MYFASTLGTYAVNDIVISIETDIARGVPNKPINKIAIMVHNPDKPIDSPQLHMETISPCFSFWFESHLLGDCLSFWHIKVSLRRHIDSLSS